MNQKAIAIAFCCTLGSIALESFTTWGTGEVAAFSEFANKRESKSKQADIAQKTQKEKPPPLLFRKPPPVKKSFCLILDRSGGMIAGKKYWDYENMKIRTGKSAMVVLREETIQYVQQIDRYFKNKGKVLILFHGDEVTRQPFFKWGIPVTDAKKLIEWVKTIGPNGKNNPVPASQAAFKLDPLPDIVIWISGSNISAQEANEIIKLRQRIERKARPYIRLVFIDFPGNDEASLLMSRYAGVAKQPPDVARRIEGLKREHQKNRSNFATKRELSIERFSRIAKDTHGTFTLMRRAAK